MCKSQSYQNTIFLRASTSVITLFVQTLQTLHGCHPQRHKTKQDAAALDIRTCSSTLLGWQSFKIYNKWTQLKSKMTIIVVRIGPTLFLTSLGQKSEICALWAMKTAKEATTKLQFEGTIRKEALIRILNPRIFLFISVKPFLAFPPLPSSLLGKIIVGRAPHSWQSLIFSQTRNHMNAYKARTALLVKQASVREHR